MSESVFDMSEMLESINLGVNRYDMSQLYPVSGNISQAIVGQGQASGVSTFQWQDSAQWWSPYQSYFLLNLQFTVDGAAPTEAQRIAYADNFAMTLFSQIQSYINSRPLDTINTPWIIDTALTYSNGKQNFIKTWGSLSRCGEALTTRMRNLFADGGNLTVAFRPPLSLFDIKLCPPGMQAKITFNFAPNGLLAFESVGGSLGWGTGAGSASAPNVSISINSFSFFKASVQPANNVQLPARGVIDLMPCQALQYFVNAGNTLKQNITLPGTTNRVLVVFQDISNGTVDSSVVPVDKTVGVGNGYNPATSFSTQFCTQGSPDDSTFAANTTKLSQLWLSLPELGIQEPQPIYTFNTDGQDLMRAYSDFCHLTQGTHHQSEGSIPFGSDNVSAGITIIQPVIFAAVPGAPTGVGRTQRGDINNYQQFTYIPAATAPSSLIANPLSYNQTAKWGWSGSRPGPIFAFPVVRPEGRFVTTGTLNAAMFGSVNSVSATVIASYSMAIALELQPGGHYSYTLVDGV